MRSEHGTYIFVLKSTKSAPIRVGRLGILQLQPGFYVYIDSAHGPGGLQARLAHHLKATARPRWHIDYLRAHTGLVEVWYSYDRNRWECRWADCLRRMRGASMPVKGFGSSDCQCGSHLFFFKSQPAIAAFARRLMAVHRRHPPLWLYRVTSRRRLRPHPECHELSKKSNVLGNHLIPKFANLISKYGLRISFSKSSSSSSGTAIKVESWFGAHHLSCPL